MKTQPIATLTSTRLSYGCMRIAGAWVPSDVTPEKIAIGRRALLAAFEAGYTLFDHADIYCHGLCEQIFGDLLHDTPSLRRADFLIATKCGVRFAGDPAGSPQRLDFSYEHIIFSAEHSLKRLGVDTIDLYQFHRPEPNLDPADVARAFDQLQKQGKVRHFGVSNFAPSTVNALQAALPMPLVVNQVPIFLGHLNSFTDGTLDQCIEKNITPLSWSPLGGGFLGTGATVPADDRRRTLLESIQKTLDEIAPKYNISRTVLALAWLLKHPSKIIPIVGSINPAHIKDAATADNIDLSREDWYRLLTAARGEPLP